MASRSTISSELKTKELSILRFDARCFSEVLRGITATPLASDQANDTLCGELACRFAMLCSTLFDNNDLAGRPLAQLFDPYAISWMLCSRQ